MIFANLLISKQRSLSVLMSMLFLCILLFGGQNVALAGTKQLMMSPLRMVFTDRQRAISAHVSNTSNESINYRISLVTMRKGPDGRFYEPVTETQEEQMVKKMIRFAPRRATIAPGTRQVVKLMLRKPKDLPPGEYRTRLLLSPQQTSGSGSTQSSSGGERKASIQMSLIVNSSFPIIIQHGGLTADVAPQSIAIKDFPQSPSGIAAEVSFSRSGDGSAFGDVFLRFTPNDNSEESREIGRALGLAIYLPDTKKNLTVVLNGITRQEFSKGTVRVVYRPSTGVAEKRKLKHSSQEVARDFTMR